MKKFVLTVLLALHSLASFANTPIPFEILPSGHMQVNVKVNEKVDYPFIIDTGAQGAMIPTALFEQLDIDKSKLEEVQVQGAVSAMTVKTMVFDSLTVGSHKVNNVGGVINDIHTGSGLAKPAVLPYTFLSNFKVEFNLKDKTLTLHDKNTKFNQHELSTIPVELISGSFISMPMLVGKTKFHGTLDSGAGNRITFNWKAASLANINKQDKSLTKGKELKGAGGGKMETKLFPELQFEVDTLSFTQPIEIADMPVLKMLHGDGPSANVGIGIFADRRVIIDYDAKQLLVSEIL